LKHAEGKILNRKIRIFCDFEKRAKSHAYDLTTKITEATKTYLNFPFKNFVVFVSFVVIREVLARANPHVVHRSCNCQTI
jgi:hypothetical protein